MIETKIIKAINSSFKNECDICFISSLFRMKNSYKPLDFYIKNFKQWLKVIPDNSYVCLYVDGSVLDDVLFLEIFESNNSCIEIVVYEDVNFLLPSDNSKDYYHDGTFGSIVRFLPLYDKSVKTKYLWFTDLDLFPKWFSGQFIKDLETKKCLSSYTSGIMMPDIRSSHPVDFQMFAGHVIITNELLNRFNNTDIQTFLQNVLNNVYEPVKNKIIGFDTKTVNATKNSKFAYGFDELFCNDFILPIISKAPRLIYCSMYLPGLEYKISGMKEDLFFMNKYNEFKLTFRELLIGNTQRKNFNKVKYQLNYIYRYLTTKNFKLSKYLKHVLSNYKKYPMEYYEHYPYGTIIKV